ncbi:hypothetical protein LUZ60_002474 [Juncus effusus]|nr:hypothetical protein LUZ60_002474 [Juncus effusus]
MLEIVRRVLFGVLTCAVALVGSIVGVVIGFLMGLATESGMFRGAAIGAITGAVFCIEAVEASLDMWSSGKPFKEGFFFVMDIILSLWNGRIVWEKVYPAVHNAVLSQINLTSQSIMENIDVFETGSIRGMSKEALENIPKAKITEEKFAEMTGDNSCCSVCLQDFRVGLIVRILPKCEHAFHVPCIDIWLTKHGSCPLCRSAT